MDFWEPGAYTATRVYHRIDYAGIENIPSRGPALIVPKHQKYMDIVLEGMLLKRYCGRYGNWIMRDKIPLPQRLLYDLGGIIILRPQDIRKRARKIKNKKKRTEFLEEAKQKNADAFAYVEWLFQRGEVVVAHLEGTRTPGGVGPLESRMFGFISDTEEKYNINIPIIPVGIEYKGFWMPFSEIYVKVGEPLSADTENLAGLVREEIAKLSNNLPLIDKSPE